MQLPLAYLAYLVALLPPALASSGDRSPIFQSCLSTCRAAPCPPLPLSLRLTRWSCASDCAYRCMHALTSNALHDGRAVEQYYGKWPFWRFAGAQEPASVLFSVMNGWMHVRGLAEVARRVPADHPLRRYYLWVAYTGMNAWLWSAVFHTRDTPWTERLDYFSAGLTILYSLFFAVVRLFHLYTPSARTRPPTTASPSPFLLPWAALCIILYICHVSYLTWLPKVVPSLPRFDYGYNMAASVAVGIVHNIVWLLYSIPGSPVTPFPARGRAYRPKHAYKPPIFVAVTTAATCLELFDFPPWRRILDAHSLWHLATVPIVPFWYQFLIEDALDEGWRPEKKPEKGEEKPEKVERT